MIHLKQEKAWILVEEVAFLMITVDTYSKANAVES